MRLNIMLHGGDFDLQMETLVRGHVPPKLRVASMEADWPVDERVMCSEYQLIDQDHLAPTIWAASYRWVGEVDSAVSLVDLWLE